MKRALRLGLAGMIGGHAALALAAPEARAQEAPQVPGWAFGSVGGEVALGAVSAASPAFYFLPQRRSKWGPYAPVARDADAGLLSNVLGGPGAVLFASSFGYLSEWAYLGGTAGDAQVPVSALRASVVDFEAAMLSTGLVQLIKRMAGRCRPRAWSIRAHECVPLDDDDYAAFPSGHTAPVAAIAGSRLTLALRSEGGELLGWRYGAFAFAETLSLAAAYLRVRAGAHSWEDVTAGWLIGHATGALVMLAHPLIDAKADPRTRTSASALSRAPVFFTWGGVF